ncbi:hypothetical protein FRX94_03000 [Corynebacterium canis]|uniref:Uncharacterized protein n=1 Tax=Corynebacterium canis TaxID=679663 RepID=A0A5C5USF6_9CORY|nr:hypothetical protein [Corynebacterium canis]TWT28552.1 hypothetical protein FRX94_03000 [Corynebacterium canis]WJY75858.1 hypothetical protein CCANI_10160 [Corynebacterium canis]
MILRGTVRAAYEELGLPSDDATIDKVWQEIVAGAAGRAETIHTMLSQQIDPELGLALDRELPGRDIPVQASYGRHAAPGDWA